VLRSTNLYGGALGSTGLELERILENILRNKEDIINGLNEVETVTSWYKEAKENPDNIPSIIVNEIIEKIVDEVEKPLDDFLEIKIKTNEIGVNFSIKPYVKFIKKLNGKNIGDVSITFEIKFSGKLEGGRVYSDLQGRRAVAERFVTAITISIIKIRASILGLPETSWDRPIQIYHNGSLKIENLSFPSTR
jgi:hypothetical protein